MSGPTGASNKRTNFTPGEKKLLLTTVAKYKHIVENKCTKADIVHKKIKIWDTIVEEFNCSAETGSRSAKQLKILYDNLKRQTRKSVPDDEHFRMDLRARHGLDQDIFGTTIISETNDFNYRSAVCSAIEQNNLELVKSLLEKDEDVCSASDITGYTPLITAIHVKNHEIVKYLLEKGASLTVHSALPFAIEQNDLEIVKILVQYGANVNRYYRRTKQMPLMQAINLKNWKMVEVLLENGADPNKENFLEAAMRLKCHNIVESLIEKGADVNQPFLLKLAIEEKDLRSIVLLVNYGANVDDDIEALEQFSKENEDFEEFFNKKIASQFIIAKHEVAF